MGRTSVHAFRASPDDSPRLARQELAAPDTNNALRRSCSRNANQCPAFPYTAVQKPFNAHRLKFPASFPSLGVRTSTAVIIFHSMTTLTPSLQCGIGPPARRLFAHVAPGQPSPPPTPPQPLPFQAAPALIKPLRLRPAPQAKVRGLRVNEFFPFPVAPPNR